MEAVEEGEDTNHIMVLPTTSGEQGGGGAGEAGPEKNSSQRPKPRMQVEIRQVQFFFLFFIYCAAGHNDYICFAIMRVPLCV